MDTNTGTRGEDPRVLFSVFPGVSWHMKDEEATPT